MLDSYPLSYILFAKLFSKYTTCLFILLTGSSAEQKLKFWWSLIYQLFSFVNHILGILSKNFSPSYSSQLFSPMLFSLQIMSDTSQPQGLQGARLPCPSPSLGVCLRSCPLNQWCHPTISSSIALFSFCLHYFPASGFFSNELAVHNTWPKYWSSSFSFVPAKEYSGLISFKIDWFDLLAFQETLKSVLPHHSSKASIFQCSAFFIVQLSHQYMTTALTTGTFVSEVISLLFNTLSRFVIASHLLLRALGTHHPLPVSPGQWKTYQSSDISMVACKARGPHCTPSQWAGGALGDCWGFPFIFF